MPKQTPKLETITGKDLLAQPIQTIEYTIDNILPHGLFILAGSSKIGKSWMALDMCHAIATGGKLWNYSAKQGDVLYLALEDNHKRLQERLTKISSVQDSESTTDIHFVTKVCKLKEGLTEQITKFLDEHPQTKLIVIDTLQYIRNNSSSRSTYAGDYRDMDALRRIITGRNLTMLLITHNRKSDDADPVNRVYGSGGLTGAVDGIFILEKSKRTGSTARLTIANRDTEGHQFKLQFDTINCRWQFVEEIKGEVDYDEDEYLFLALECLLDETQIWSGTPTHLCAVLTQLDSQCIISPITLSKTLKKRQEHLFKQYNISCGFTRNKSARIITLSRDVIVIEGAVVKEESA
ncbi:MAG: helicase RepA family protein [Oscillospiraceae bacterium]|nr:helicase RepA family protein [Oscillospiraceae bacterium]